MFAVYYSNKDSIRVRVAVVTNTYVFYATINNAS